MFDSHIHTQFSTDSDTDIEKIIERAQKLNLGIIITDHMDTNFPRREKFNFNTEEYFNAYSKYRSDKVLLGIELGLTEQCQILNKQIADENKFDFVMGSIHFLGNCDMYFPEAYKGKTKQEAFEQYFTLMINNIKCHKYIDSLGHIDYISRYAVYEDKEIYYEAYKELIDEVFRLIIDNNIALELNSRRLANKNSFDILQTIYKRYKELGGKYITIGSDAHTMDAVGNNFANARLLAENCELKAVYFKERKMQYI